MHGHASPPCFKIAPGEVVHFETVGGSSGQLSPTALFSVGDTHAAQGVDKKGYEMTTGIGPDLMTGARTAVSEMIELLSRRFPRIVLE